MTKELGMTKMQVSPVDFVDLDRSINMDCMEISELRELCDRTVESFAAGWIQR